jgi:putative flavoprotein involved in K+ transport
MRSISAIVIGAGQAGLAMSHCLTSHGVEHVVLERGRTAERWHSERWASLRLLTPNWMSRLPGWSWQGPDPDDFMSAARFAKHLEAYEQNSCLPVEHDTEVLSVQPHSHGYRVQTDCGVWLAQVVIIATGHCDIPYVPPMGRELPSGILQVTPTTYWSPASLPPGGVLVVGASATGVQLADEIQQSGRQVTIAVGRHTRLPRRYRGRDIWWWLDHIGLLDETPGTDADADRARQQPSFQLVGRSEHETLDLGTLRDGGVRLVGRAVGIDGSSLHLADDLTATTAAAQKSLERLLDRIDLDAASQSAPRKPDAARPIAVEAAPNVLDLAGEGIRTVVWATGYRRNYSWLQVPVLSALQEIVHDGGVTSWPGLYVLGLRFMRRRRSNFIDGVGRDAQELAEHAAGYLASRRSQAA